MTYDPDSPPTDDTWRARLSQLEREHAKLLTLAAEMRRRQKVYFSTRSPGSLQEAKKVERAFDELLAELNQEPKIF